MFVPFTGLSQLSWIPLSVQQSLLSKFTEFSELGGGGGGGGGSGHVLSRRMKDKILSHLFVLGLMVDQYTLDTSQLQKDLKIPSNK